MKSRIIVTSSWSTQLPNTHARIGISRGVPRGTPSGYRMFRDLAPGGWFKSLPHAEYRTRYFNEVLTLLDPQKTVDALLRLADGKVPALLCFEGPTDARWCHRALVSIWLKETLDLEVLEYGLEHEGCAHKHPKLP